MKPQEDPRFRALIENARDVFTIADARGVILFESPSIHALLGFTPDELVGRNIFELFHTEDAAETLHQFQTLASQPGAVIAVQTRLRHKEGDWIHVEAQGTNLLDNPDIRGIVINTRDITARKVAEDKLNERTQELEQLNRFMVGRELRMIELKKEVATLRKELDKLERNADPMDSPALPPASPSGE